jgi:hypothetical protein
MNEKQMKEQKRGLEGKVTRRSWIDVECFLF